MSESDDDYLEAEDNEVEDNEVEVCATCETALDSDRVESCANCEDLFCEDCILTCHQCGEKTCNKDGIVCQECREDTCKDCGYHECSQCKDQLCNECMPTEVVGPICESCKTTKSTWGREWRKEINNMTRQLRFLLEGILIVQPIDFIYTPDIICI